MVCAHAMLWLTKRSKTTIFILACSSIPCSQEMKEDRERLLDRGVKECGVIRPGEYHDREQHSPYSPTPSSASHTEERREEAG